MSDPYIGEIRLFAGNYAPVNWALCQGQLMPISQNTTLFSILGTTYGGDGRTTFALPNLQNSVPIGMGQGPGLTDRELGEAAGEPGVALISSEMPMHTHQAMAANATADQPSPQGNHWSNTAARPLVAAYAKTPAVVMNPMAIGVAGGSQPHDNMQPSLTVTYIIALQGIYPQFE